jgi:hypothetical protein
MISGTSVAPLPYDMGNAGDLIKHGLLAEFTWWWCGLSGRPIRFVDPFGGRPWVEPPVPIVAARVKALSEFALRAGQPHPERRYYGSGHVVRRVAHAAGQRAEVFVSDSDWIARRDLVSSGLKELQYPGFDATDGYSILKTEIEADLILIDPFDFLLNDLPVTLPQISQMSRRIAIVVFVLIRDLMNDDRRRYASIRATQLPHAWIFRCPPLRHTGVRGEENFTVEVLLAAPKYLMQTAAASLKDRLAGYADCLTDTLGSPVTFTAGATTKKP